MLHVEGRQIALVDRGDGPPILLVHASGLGALQWGGIVPRLADRWRILAPDLLGCGGSDPWPDPDAYDVNADLAVVRAVAEHAGAPVHVVGHSYGGLLALRLACETPALVRSVALYEPVAFGALAEADPAAHAALFDTLGADFLELATGGDEAWLRRFIDFWNGPGAWDALAPARRAALLGTGRKSFLEVRAMTLAPTPLAGLRAPQPTLLLCGTRSPPAALGVCRALAGGLPHARLEIFEGAGHMAPVEEPRRFLQALVAHLG